MKSEIFIMCALITLGLGCKKENEQIDRYKVFSATWEDSYNNKTTDGNLDAGMIAQKALIKVDSATGRVWFWHRQINDTNDRSGWVEMADSGFVLPSSLQPKNH